MESTAALFDAGTALLKFSHCGSQTVVSRSFATNPLKLFTTRARARACWVYSSSLGGGYVGGDEVRLRVEVDDRARAVLTTQASTKVYRSPRRASQELTARIAHDALLVIVPDPIVCFADADFLQTQRYELSRDASLVMVDWFTSGRHAAGERWAFRRYESRLDIRREGTPIFFDTLVLQHGLDAIGDRMGPFEVFVTAILTGPLVSAPAAELLADVSRAAVTRPADMIMSAAKLGDGGTLLRMAGADVERVGRALRSKLAFLRSLIGDDPWSRKW